MNRPATTGPTTNEAATLVAILRGVRPEEAADMARAVRDAGLRHIEVPLNSPEPLRSIEAMAAVGGIEVGAGTVLSVDDVQAVQGAGGTFIVSPNTDARVIAATVERGMGSYPGAFTATECFAAIEAGCTALKIFPASALGPSGIAALKAVLPPAMPVLAVGGAGPEDFAAYVKAGCDGFGLGSFLYKPGRTPAEVGAAARRCVEAFEAAR